MLCTIATLSIKLPIQQRKVFDRFFIFLGLKEWYLYTVFDKSHEANIGPQPDTRPSNKNDAQKLRLALQMQFMSMRTNKSLTEVILVTDIIKYIESLEFKRERSIAYCVVIYALCCHFKS